MSRLTYCKKFFIERKLFTKDKDYTHLLLDGGKVKINQENISDFHNNYFMDIRCGNKNYICETKTDIFKLFMDLDFMYSVTIDKEFIDTCICFINTIVVKVFDIDKFKLFICETEDKKIIKNGKETLKKGIHIVWDSVFVNKKTSIALRGLLLKYIEIQPKLALENTGIENDWNDIIDLSVFKANGLRMIKSHKMVPCNKHNDDTKGVCNNENCINLYNDVRKIDEGRPYSVSKITNQDFIDIGDFKYTPLHLEEISIQTFGNLTTSIHTEFEDYICNFKEETKYKIPRSNPNPKSVVDTKVNEIITKTINESFKEISQFQNLNIKSVYNVSEETATIQVDCKYCMCKKGFHNSNRVYFVLYKYWLFQKCYCICPDKKCKDYSSRKKKVSSDIIHMLLPEYYKSQVMPSGLVLFGHPETFEDKLKRFMKNTNTKIE